MLISKTKSAGGKGANSPYIPDRDPSLKSPQRRQGAAAADAYDAAGGAFSRDPEIPDWDPSLKTSPKKAASSASSSNSAGGGSSIDTKVDEYDRLIGTPTKTTVANNVTLCKLWYKSPHTGRKLTHGLVLKGNFIINFCPSTSRSIKMPYVTFNLSK